MVFTRWPREDSFPTLFPGFSPGYPSLRSDGWEREPGNEVVFFPRFSSTGRKISSFKSFCNIFLQDLTPLHVNITRSTNLLSVCWRKLKLSTYLFTAVTSNTPPQRFFSSVQTCGLVDVNQPLPRVCREKTLSPFLEHLEEHVGL